MIRKTIIVLLTFLSILSASCLALSHFTPKSWRWIYDGKRIRIYYYKGEWGMDNYTAINNYAATKDEGMYRRTSFWIKYNMFILTDIVEFDPNKIVPPPDRYVRLPGMRSYCFIQSLHEKLPYQGTNTTRLSKRLTPKQALQYQTVILRRDISAVIWPFIVLFSVYPAIVFIRGPLRRWQKRLRYRKGLCSKCGYNLTGNESGICSECGHAIENNKYKTDADRKSIG